MLMSLNFLRLKAERVNLNYICSNYKMSINSQFLADYFIFPKTVLDRNCYRNWIKQSLFINCFATTKMFRSVIVLLFPLLWSVSHGIWIPPAHQIDETSEDECNSVYDVSITKLSYQIVTRRRWKFALQHFSASGHFFWKQSIFKIFLRRLNYMPINWLLSSFFILWFQIFYRNKHEITRLNGILKKKSNLFDLANEFSFCCKNGGWAVEN